MISFHSLPNTSSIRDLKTRYLESLLAPLDGMWETGLIDPAPHWEIRVDGEQAGYYAANDQGTLLQLHLLPAFETQGREVFEQILAQESLSRATVSTLDPTYLSLCLDAQKKVKVHTYLYELHQQISSSQQDSAALEFRLVDALELERTIAFQQACLGGDQDLSGWLRGYSANLISRNELLVLCQGEDWIGVGEHRRSDSQAGVADLGMMVAPSLRGHGWATHILTLLVARSKTHRDRPICSTTVENLGAQKAILRSGFVSRHRILDVSF